MIEEQMPTMEKLRREGRFLGYSLQDNYADVVRWKNKNYLVLDSLGPNGKLVYNIHIYYDRVGLLANSFSEFDGSIF